MHKKATVTLFALCAFALTAGPGLAEEAKDAKKDDYPLKKCVVSGEDLGSMGKPYVHTYTQEIKLCCKPCLEKFLAKPERYIGIVEKAKRAAKKPAPKDTPGKHDHHGKK